MPIKQNKERKIEKKKENSPYFEREKEKKENKDEDNKENENEKDT